MADWTGLEGLLRFPESSSRVQRALLVVISFGVACSAAENPALASSSETCAELVAFHRELGQSVEVVDAELKGDARHVLVRIDYETGDRSHAGSALCQLKRGVEGPRALVAALVDQNRVDDDRIEAFSSMPRAQEPDAP